MTAYYNEFDPHAAAWLRELVAAGEIPDGIVDERSIEDVRPDELLGYTQCHFFAGIGGWPLALRLAGWPDDRPIWTGSCPCQPFSAAGKGAGFDDERHLWPSFYWLIAQCRPAIVAGEQVASKAVDAWIDLVQADMEALGYAFGSVPFPAAGIGAPHIRDRAYWIATGSQLADASGPRSPTRLPAAEGRHQGQPGVTHNGSGELSGARQRPEAGGSGFDWVAHHPELGRREERQDTGGRGAGDSTEGVTAGCLPSGADSGLADADCGRLNETRPSLGTPGDDGPFGNDGDAPRQSAAGPTNGHWRAADWLLCRDGKWRPVEPGTFPLVDGLPRGVVHSSDPGAPGYAEQTSEARLMRLKGFGNAIVPQQAAIFIQAAIP